MQTPCCTTALPPLVRCGKPPALARPRGKKQPRQRRGSRGEGEQARLQHLRPRLANNVAFSKAAHRQAHSLSFSRRHWRRRLGGGDGEGVALRLDSTTFPSVTASFALNNAAPLVCPIAHCTVRTLFRLFSLYSHSEVAGGREEGGGITRTAPRNRLPLVPCRKDSKRLSLRTRCGGCAQAQARRRRQFKTRREAEEGGGASCNVHAHTHRHPSLQAHRGRCERQRISRSGDEQAPSHGRSPSALAPDAVCRGETSRPLERLHKHAVLRKVPLSADEAAHRRPVLALRVAVRAVP